MVGSSIPVKDITELDAERFDNSFRSVAVSSQEGRVVIPVIVDSDPESDNSIEEKRLSWEMCTVCRRVLVVRGAREAESGVKVSASAISTSESESSTSISENFQVDFILLQSTESWGERPKRRLAGGVEKARGSSSENEE